MFVVRTGIKHQFTPKDNQNIDIRERFYKKISNLSLNSIHAYWSKIVFTGRGLPPASLTPHEIGTVFTSNKDVIVYVYENQIPPKTKIVYREN
jgi:hypothetical protein